MLPLPVGPAVVPALLDAVDLLPALFADVSQPEVPGGAIEVPAPGIAEAPGVDLRTAAAARQGVVRRDRVRRSAVHVQAQHLSGKHRQVLGVRALAIVPEPKVEK